MRSGIERVGIRVCELRDQAVALRCAGDLVGALFAHFVACLTTLAEHFADRVHRPSAERTFPIHATRWCTSGLAQSRVRRRLRAGGATYLGGGILSVWPICSFCGSSILLAATRSSVLMLNRWAMLAGLSPALTM